MPYRRPKICRCAPDAAGRHWRLLNKTHRLWLFAHHGARLGEPQVLSNRRTGKLPAPEAGIADPAALTGVLAYCKKSMHGCMRVGVLHATNREEWAGTLKGDRPEVQFRCGSSPQNAETTPQDSGSRRPDAPPKLARGRNWRSRGDSSG